MRFSLRKALRLSRQSFALKKPHHVQWMLTRRCNYRCKSCDVWRDERPVSELSTEEVKAGLDILRELGAMELVLSGGNPLLREDIKEIIDYASRYFITTIYDNGSQAVNRIDALYNADFVAISLDTLNCKKYDYLKGVTGAWKHALDAVKTLHNNGISVGVSPTISQLNMSEILSFTDHFTERGIPVLYCLYQHDSLAEPMFQIGEKNNELEIVDKIGLASLCDDLIKKKERHNGILITKKMLRALKHLYLTGKRAWTCQALQSFFTVDPRGRVAGCHLQKPVASIFDLPKLWKSDRFEALRREHRQCSGCSYMCYMFYSMHVNVQGNLEIMRDQWKNVRTLMAG